MDACLILLCFIFFLALSQDISWEESLQNDPFCVGCDVKP